MSLIQVLNKADGYLIALAVLIIVALKVSLGDDRPTAQFRLFLALLLLTALMLVLDMGSWALGGRPGTRAWLSILYMVFFACHPLTTFLWALYVDFQIFFDARRLGRLALVGALPVIAAAALSLSSPATGWAFRLDESNAYSRGSGFSAIAALSFLYLLVALASTVRNWRRLAARSRLPLLLFALPPALGGAVQSLFYGVNLIWPGVALSLLMVYMNIESELLITDHLTGLQNRRSFDRQLSRALRRSPSDGAFAVVMLDLDDFKLINDRFGHAGGDEALADTASILRRCLHADDFIARYAGDEFVVLAQVRRAEDAATLCSRIEESFAAYNRERGKPWTLTASIGATVHAPGDGATRRDLMAEADAAMYARKKDESPSGDGRREAEATTDKGGAKHGTRTNAAERGV